MNQPALHLASSSARRREILTAMGLQFTFAGADIDETRAGDESARDMVLRLASAKAAAVSGSVSGDLPIIGADTVVVRDERIFGKPRSMEDGLEMLACLSGRKHQVLTAVAVLSGKAAKTAISVTDVVFREISPDEALAYWQSGEPAGKAGAYAIQGKGGIFAQSISGSYSGVVGLPVYETATLLKWARVDVLQGSA